MPRYPALYQVNTRVWLTRLAREAGRPLTLDDVPDEALDRLAARGFDWVWLLSVWQTGEAGRRVALGHPEWRREFAVTLPDLRDEDIGGSGFAIADYRVHDALGGDAALARMRARLARRGLKLMLDFVPNHTALDHPWARAHPERYVRGDERDLARAPGDWTRVGGHVLAHGRDPNFPGWPDTLQLDYADPATREAMLGVLSKVAGQCDGVRCDMAMLVLPEVFERTWGRRPAPFWPDAVRRVRARAPGFVFMAEVYWDLEWTLQQQGFDWTYDKRLYDRLRERRARPVRDHLRAGLDFQDRLARFLENHDEPRAAATFPPDVHRAAAVITFLAPGLRFLHQGQLEGARTRVSPHLVRAPDEPPDPTLAALYERLLALVREPIVRDGRWTLLEPAPAWDGNGTHDAFVAFAWERDRGERWVVVVNYADHQAQARLRLPFADLGERGWRLDDRLGGARYDRDGAELRAPGLFVDMRPWEACVFALTPLGTPALARG